MSLKTEVELGDLVRDHVTKFEGVVTGITEWLYNCRRAVVQPREIKDGKPVESQSFDVDGLEIVKKQVVPRPGKPAAARASTGGPVPNEHVALRR